MYDAIVVGLGGMGSAALAHCAARGLRVAGVERFAPLHAHGASHGRTRLIRQAYFEGSEYVPLLLRAYVLWDALERRIGEPLRARTGAIFAGPSDASVVCGTLASARAFGLEHEVLEPGDVRKRYPQFRLRAGELAVFERAGGALFPQRCVRAHLEAAAGDGAEMRFGVAVRAWRVTAPDRVEVVTASGTLQARRIVLCAGAWLANLAPQARLPIAVERNVQVWFAPPAAQEMRPERLPVFALQRPELPFMFYGFPDFGDGVKCAFHHSGIAADPDALEPEASSYEIAATADALRAWLPGAAGAVRATRACTYALTPDEHFIIGTHPGLPEAILAGGFSGHGFKFCSVVGEIVADFVQSGATAHGIEAFDPARFSSLPVPR